MQKDIINAELAVDVRCAHGEGPFWISGESALYFLDIPGMRLYRHGVETTSWSFDRQITCVLPTDKGRYLATSFEELHYWSPAAGLGEGLLGGGRPFDMAVVRHNDGAIDPDGGLMMGCLHMAETDPVAALYRYTPGAGVRRLMADFVIANGIGFSPDNQTMYLADTGSGHLYRFAYAEGVVRDREIIASYPQGVGVRPDGLSVDADGTIWLALLGGGRVEALTPEGRKLLTVTVPTPNTTSCCFGGDDLGTLYITTGQVPDDELAGAVFSCRPGVAGLPQPVFREA